MDAVAAVAAAVGAAVLLVSSSKMPASSAPALVVVDLLAHYCAARIQANVALGFRAIADCRFCNGRLSELMLMQWKRVVGISKR